MRNKDTRIISYLFNEMDPSERVEFERKLIDDENLLIEVESLKQTKLRLSPLPELHPPKHIIESVLKEAEEYSRKSVINRGRSVYYAAAAVLITGFLASAILLDQNTENSSAAQASVSAPTFETTQSPINRVTSVRQASAPLQWIDSNDVIRFSDRVSQNQTSDIDSIFKNSYKKLTPVTNPTQTGAYHRNLQLTGSRP